MNLFEVHGASHGPHPGRTFQLRGSLIDQKINAMKSQFLWASASNRNGSPGTMSECCRIAVQIAVPSPTLQVVETNNKRLYSHAPRMRLQRAVTVYTSPGQSPIARLANYSLYVG